MTVDTRLTTARYLMATRRQIAREQREGLRRLAMNLVLIGVGMALYFVAGWIR